MGLGQAFLRDLIELKRSGHLDNAKSVAEIGEQQLADSFLTAVELDDLYRLFGRPPMRLPAPVGVGNFATHAPMARPFWASLGFDYSAIDIDGDAIHLDLNRDAVPPRMRGRFDLIVNTGTTEHVANQENAFRVIHDLAREGGLMYHEVPASGMIDHGLISYQPKFFHRIAEQNDYEVLFIRLWGHPPSPVPAYWLQDGLGVPNTVADLVLRVAFRKRTGYEFSPPVDAAPHLVPKRRRSIAHRIRLEMGRAVRKFRRSLR